LPLGFALDERQRAEVPRFAVQQIEREHDELAVGDACRANAGHRSGPRRRRQVSAVQRQGSRCGRGFRAQVAQSTQRQPALWAIASETLARESSFFLNDLDGSRDSSTLKTRPPVHHPFRLSATHAMPASVDATQRYSISSEKAGRFPEMLVHFIPSIGRPPEVHAN
jgi:hypothetical protein